jgi:DNA polymerase-3 subunit beta
MKITVSQPNMARALGIVSRAVSPRSTLPVLANILITTEGDGKLRLSATNLEIGISCWIPAQIKEEGGVTIPARTLCDWIGKLPSDAISMNVKPTDQSTDVKCGRSTTNMKGIDAQEFPPMPGYDLSAGIVINLSTLKDAIRQVAFAASQDEARPALQGVLFLIDKDTLTLVATDGFRIAVRSMAIGGDNPKVSVIIPAKALTELSRIAGDCETVTVLIPPERGQVVFHLNNDTAEIVSQLIDGNFPPYKAIIPKSFKTHATISTSAFQNACEQVEIVAREGNNVTRIHVQPGTDGVGMVQLASQSDAVGAAESVIDATVKGPEIMVAFNVRFLREVLGVIKSASVILETNAMNTPAVIRSSDDDSYIHVIMPMNIDSPANVDKKE